MNEVIITPEEGRKLMKMNANELVNNRHWIFLDEQAQLLRLDEGKLYYNLFRV
jgi:hypothetical protein